MYQTSAWRQHVPLENELFFSRLHQPTSLPHLRYYSPQKLNFGPAKDHIFRPPSLPLALKMLLLIDADAEKIAQLVGFASDDMEYRRFCDHLVRKNVVLDFLYQLDLDCVYNKSMGVGIIWSTRIVSADGTELNMAGTTDNLVLPILSVLCLEPGMVLYEPVHRCLTRRMFPAGWMGGSIRVGYGPMPMAMSELLEAWAHADMNKEYEPGTMGAQLAKSMKTWHKTVQDNSQAS